MKQKELKTLLNKAQDESTSGGELRDLWFSTTSVKIRKAIASNPNATPEILRIASRLYLEEVLGNPGFEMMGLFEDDVWIKNLMLAYEDPQQFIASSVIHRYSRGYDITQYCKACLLSNNLHANSANFILLLIPQDAFKRTIKTENVASRMRKFITQSPHLFELESFIKLYRANVVGHGEIIHYLKSQYRSGISASKSEYKKFFQGLLSEYFSTDEKKIKSDLEEIIAFLFFMSRTHAIRWVVRENYVYSPFEMAKLFSKCIRRIKQIDNHLVENSGRRSSKAVLDDVIGTLGENILSYFRGKYISMHRQNPLTEDQIISHMREVYAFAHKEDLLEESFWREMAIPTSVLDVIHQCCSIKEKIFFVTRGMAGDWAVVGSPGRFPLFEEVNNYIFEKTNSFESLLFDRCQINKVIRTDNKNYVMF